MTRQEVERLQRFVLELANKGLDAQQVAEAMSLIPIGKELHRLYENACNYELSARQEAREANLEAEAEAIAASVGAVCYHQRDPRGCPLTVALKADAEKAKYPVSDCYSTIGVAVPW